jgi:hypothetical protein
MAGNQNTDTERLDYLSYLLRVWRVEVREGTIWRASLECTSTREQLGFADLEALSRYLQAETAREGGST